MTITNEHPTTEILTEAELGRKAYYAIKDLGGRILKTNEFKTAAGVAFFKRHNQDGTAPEFYGIEFTQGDYEYRVEYKSVPSEHDNTVSVSFNLTKHDLSTEESDSSLVGFLHLDTRFEEDAEGNVVKFLGGTIDMTDVPGLEVLGNHPEAFEKITTAFSDFYPAVWT